MFKLIKNNCVINVHVYSDVKHIVTTLSFLFLRCGFLVAVEEIAFKKQRRIGVMASVIHTI